MKWLIALIAGLTLSGRSHALEMDFYVYDGFSEIVMAFQRMALIFANNEYTVLFAVACVLGLFFGGLIFYAKMLLGQQGGSMTLVWLGSVLFGILIFKGLITPTGALHIYDPVRNAYQKVTGIPDVIVLAAGFTNKVERAVQRVSDTASAYPYANEGGGVSFELIMNATTDASFSSDYYLVKSIKQYYKDCSPIPLIRAGSGFDLNTLRSGTDDLLDEYKKLRSVNMFTRIYSTTSKAGTVTDCTDAFDNTLEPALPAGDLTAYQEHFDTTCRKARFDVSVALQKTQCKNRLAAAHSALFDTAAGSAPKLLRDILLAHGTAKALLEDNPDAAIVALTNKTMMTQGIGAGIAAEAWIPKVRASVLAIVLGMFPVLLLFVVTPMFARALQLIVVLLIWITLWGCIDIIVSQIAIDQAYAAADEIKRHKQGLMAFFLAPEAASQALALFAKARTMGIIISSVITAILFKMSTHGFATMAGQWSGDVENRGNQAADQAINPGDSTSALKGYAQAEADATAINDNGYDYMRDASLFNVQQGMTHANTATASLAPLTNGFSPSHAGHLSGTSSGASLAGNVTGQTRAGSHQSPAEQIRDTALQTSVTQMQQQIGATTGFERAASDNGMHARDLSDQNSYIGSMTGTQDHITFKALADEYQQSHPGMNSAESFQAVSQQKYGEYTQAAKAAGYDTDRILNAKEFSASMDLNRNESMRSFLDNEGISIAEHNQGSVAQEVVHNAASKYLNDEFGTPRQTAAPVMSGIEGITGAEEKISKANERGQTPETFERSRQELQQDRSAAELDVYDRYAEAIGRPREDIMEMQQQATGNGFIFAAEDIDRLQDRRVIDLNPEQLEAAKANGGTHGYLQLDREGNTIGISGSSGNSISQLDSVTQDASSTYNSGTSITTGTSHQHGEHWTPASAHAALADRDLFEGVVSTYIAERGNLPGARQGTDEYNRNLADYINGFARSDVTDNVVKSADTGLFGSLGIGNSSVTSLGASANARLTGNTAESDSYDANRPMIDNWFNEAYHSAENQLRTDPQFKDRVYTDDNIRESADWQEARQDIMTEIARNNILQRIDHLKEEAHDHVKDTDRYNNEDEKGVSNRDRGRPRGPGHR